MTTAMIRRVAARLLQLGAPALFGCSLLDVSNPGQVTTGVLDDPANIQLAATSAITDFECAFANYDIAQALMGDEMTWGDLNTAQWDQRNWNPDGLPGYAL